MARLSRGQHLAVLSGSLLLVTVATYPLVLDPGHLLPLQGRGQAFHKDPMMYGWTMVSNTRRLLSSPLAVFHGNTFYPHGNVVAHSDLLLAPTLFPASAVYLLTGNPVLQYNVTLLAWWALSVWAMYVLTFGLLRSHAGAAVAAVAFGLCPFRTDFFLEFQMQLAFPIPLALLALLRFLETHGRRYLAAALALVWVEALASMYYAIILGLCLGVVAASHFLLRGWTWSGRLVRRGAAGLAILGLALAPFMVPYVQNWRELGLQRDLHQPPGHSADILTYLETGPAGFYHFSPTGHTAETSLFMGFVALGLAVWAMLDPAARGEVWAPIGILRVRRLLTAGTLAALLLSVASVAARLPPRVVGVHLPPPLTCLLVVLFTALLRLVLEGWWAARRDAPPGLDALALRWLCLVLIVLFFMLSLGPEMQYRGVPLGRGLYAHLYPYVLPLHAMRVTSRIGIIVVLGVALLAGMGARTVDRRLAGRPWRWPVLAGLILFEVGEYAPGSLPYGRLDWEHPPPVYRALAGDADDVAVLEWPQNLEDSDDYFTFMSINHWKRLVNGASGFSPMGPPMTRDISDALSALDDPADPFPTERARRYLLGIHPLRYVVVHNALLDPPEQRKWQKLQLVPWARLVGRYGPDDLYRLTGEAAGPAVEKFFSWDYARGKTTLSLDVRAVGPGARRRWIDVDLNGRLLGQSELRSAWSPVILPLAGPRLHSAPNVVTIRSRYRDSDAHRPIGRTGVVAPVDIRVVSGGMEAGDVASVVVEGQEVARNHRGYNVVALERVTGAILWTDAFDTFASSRESERLAMALAALPPGTVVAVAVKDEASGDLTEEGLAALRSLGAEEDIRGRFRVSHALVGVKGAAPGTAAERVGYDRLAVTLGIDPGEFGIEVRDFALR